MKLSSLLSVGGVLQRNQPTGARAVEARQAVPMSWQTYQELFTFNGQQYYSSQFFNQGAQYLAGSCGPVASVIDRRVSVMGEARPSFQRFVKGKPGDLYSTPALDILKRPWPGGTFRQLVAIADGYDVPAFGNSYWIRVGNRLVRLEADWVTIVRGEVMVDGVDTDGRPGSAEVGYELLGYAVQRPGHKGIVLEPEQVGHYKPGAPTDQPFRGESWLAAVAADATSDIELTRYKGNYLKNGAMPSIAVMYEPTLDMAQLEEFVPQFAAKFAGSDNAGRVLHFLGGRDVKTVGATLDQLAFKAVQGAGETRIAAAAGVPASVAGFSEGMQGSSLNAGNYTATRRLFGDAKIRPLLGAFCEAFQNLVRVDADSRLWYDDSQVSFFQEDVADEATIRETTARTVKTYIEAGYEPDAALEAATTGNTAALKGRHTGLTSVQLQEPGRGSDADAARNVVEMIQKVYLGVGIVLSDEEARDLLNRAGAGLPPGALPRPSTTDGSGAAPSNEGGTDDQPPN